LSRKDGRAGAQPDDQRQQQEEHGKERRGRRDAVHAQQAPEPEAIEQSARAV
jgi:hypothetical protein